VLWKSGNGEVPEQEEAEQSTSETKQPGGSGTQEDRSATILSLR
jgi:hypothetical protein